MWVGVWGCGVGRSSGGRCRRGEEGEGREQPNACCSPVLRAEEAPERVDDEGFGAAGVGHLVADPEEEAQDSWWEGRGGSG